MRCRSLPSVLPVVLLVGFLPAAWADPSSVLDVDFEDGTCLEWSDSVPFCETPGVGLRIVLTWSTPGDPDETDDDGSDLDLHVLHPDAAGDWEGDWDCWAGNPAPDWGTGGPSNDGVLVRGDADGAGPEVVQVTDPEPGAYDFGIHFVTDRGYGPAIATVELYVDGELRYQYSSKVLTDGQFWTVGWISLPSGAVEVVDTVSSGIP